MSRNGINPRLKMENSIPLTKEQEEQILHHARAAALARALQWDHELAIEAILGHEVELGIEDFAAGVDVPASELKPEDLTFIVFEDLDLEEA